MVFVMSILTSSHAARVGLVASPAAGGMTMKARGSEVAPQKTVPEKEEKEVVPTPTQKNNQRTPSTTPQITTGTPIGVTLPLTTHPGQGVEGRTGGAPDNSARMVRTEQRQKQFAAQGKAIAGQLAVKREALKKEQKKKIETANKNTMAKLKTLTKKKAMAEDQAGSQGSPQTWNQEGIQAGHASEVHVQLKPVIQGHFGFPSPGGVLCLTGVNFDDQAGDVVLRYQDWKGSYKSVDTYISQWSEIAIGIILPPFIEGFKHQTAKLQVITRKGAKGDLYGFQFNPIDDYKDLTMLDPGINVTCGTEANYNECNKNLGSWTAVCVAPSIPAPDVNATFDGRHSNCWATEGNDVDDDVYEINLQNGWTFHSMKMATYKTSNDETVENPNPPLPVASSYWKPSINWGVSPNDLVRYKVWVTISGPKGVPYQ